MARRKGVQKQSLRRDARAKMAAKKQRQQNGGAPSSELLARRALVRTPHQRKSLTSNPNANLVLSRKAAKKLDRKLRLAGRQVDSSSSCSMQLD